MSPYVQHGSQETQSCLRRLWMSTLKRFQHFATVRFHAYSAYMTLVQLCVGVSETLSQKPRVTGGHPKLHVEEKMIWNLKGT